MTIKARRNRWITALVPLTVLVLLGAGAALADEPIDPGDMYPEVVPLHPVDPLDHCPECIPPTGGPDCPHAPTVDGAVTMTVLTIIISLVL